MLKAWLGQQTVLCSGFWKDLGQERRKALQALAGFADVGIGYGLRILIEESVGPIHGLLLAQCVGEFGGQSGHGIGFLQWKIG